MKKITSQQSKPFADSARRLALCSVVLNAMVSLGLVLWVGRKQTSVVLPLLFTGWVALPFVGMGWLLRATTKRLPVRMELTSWQIHGISLGSAAIYAIEVFLVHPAKQAAPFLMVPVASWLLIGIFSWKNQSLKGEDTPPKQN